MRPIPIRVRLAAWYSLIMAVSLCVFGVVADLAIEGSIRGTVNDHAQQTVQTAEHVLKMEPLSIGRKRAHCVCLTGSERLQQELKLGRRRLKRRKTRSSPHVKATHLNQSKV